VDVSAPLEAHPQAAELVQPGDRALDDPTVDAQPATMADAAPRESGSDAPQAQGQAVDARVVGTVAVQLVRSEARTTDAAANRGDRVDQRHELCPVVLVGGCQRGAQGDPGGVGDDVVLASRTRPIGGVGPAFFPPLRRLGSRTSR
jgi:hypothetical protein